MDLLDSRGTALRLDYLPLSDAIEAVLRDSRIGKVRAPERSVIPLPGGGVLLLMPACDERLAMTKILTVHPGNPTNGLPTIQGEVLVMDAASGRRLGMLDGPMVTARRTAALSLLAARKLARTLDGPIFVIGAGVQAKAHLEAFASSGVRKAFLFSRGQERARDLVNHGRELGVDCTVAVDFTDLPRCPLLVTATTSLTPVFSDEVSENISGNAFIAAVGAFKPHMAELPPALVRRARVYVCTMEGAKTEAGDLHQAGVDWRRVTALADALDGPRPETGPVVFKSVGHALFDLAAARLAFPGKKVL